MLKLFIMRIYTTGTYKKPVKPTGAQAEFCRVAKCSKLIRDAFHQQLFNLGRPDWRIVCFHGYLMYCVRIGRMLLDRGR